MADRTNHRSSLPPALSLAVEPDALTRLVRTVVEETLSALEADRASLGEKLAYPEPEAAALLSLNPHQLRDERLRRRIKASVGPGRKILYSHQDLLDYLAERRWGRERK